MTTIKPTDDALEMEKVTAALEFGLGYRPPPEDARLRILGIQVENFKRVRLIELHPDGRSLVIGGRNAQGKSSLLDGIAAALGGAKRSPTVPLRTGAVRGKAVVDLGEYRVMRQWTPSSDKLTVIHRIEGEKKSPQKILDGLIADISFDPLSFVRAAGKDQAETLRRLSGLDTADLDVERGRVYAERTAVNGEVKRSEAYRDSLPATTPRPPEPPARPSVGELLQRRKQLTADQAAAELARKAFAELERKREAMVLLGTTEREAAVACNVANGRASHIAQGMRSAFEEMATARGCFLASETPGLGLLQSTAVDVHDQLGRLIAQLLAVRDHFTTERDGHTASANAADAAAAEMDRQITARRRMVGDLPDHAKEIAEIEAAMVDADRAMAEADRATQLLDDWKRASVRRREAEDAVDRQRVAAQAKTDRLAAIDRERQIRLAAAKMPVDGLGVEGDTVTFNGRPLEQASQAEQVIVGLSIGAALNPRCAFVLVREGAFLDDANLKVALAWAAERKLQLILETVGNREGVGVIIEDGRVSDEAPTTAGGGA